ncbi:MAG: thioredoxin domain-containing protein [Candidatus Sulfotelmatobacter sp.]
MKTLSSYLRTFYPRTLFLLFLTALLLANSLCAAADEAVNPVLRPPKGAPVAIIVFEDLQCPQCRRVSPILEQASKTYKIPLVRHDFPLPMHNWSYDAAVMARYFDSISKPLGNEFRDYIFANQLEINPQNLRGYAERFATEHKVDFPFVVDPQGKFAAEVNADRDIGKAIKLDHTPTVYVVSSRNPGRPYVEMKDASQLYQLIDAMMNQ